MGKRITETIKDLLKYWGTCTALSLAEPVGVYLSKDIHYPFETMQSFMLQYFNDISGPFGYYFGIRTLFSRSFATAQAIGVCSLFELLQSSYNDPGYDPKDFLAYAAGITLALVVDKKIFGTKNLENIIRNEKPTTITP